MIVYENDPERVKEIIKKNGLVIVDFWAEWCGPCMDLGEELHKLDEKMAGKIVIVKMNTDSIDVSLVEKVLTTLEGTASNKKPVCKAFENGAIPIMMFFKNGSIVDKQLDDTKKDWVGFRVGSMSMTKVESLLSKHALV